MTTNDVYGINEIINNTTHTTAVTAKTDCSIILIPTNVFKNDMISVYKHYESTLNKKKSSSSSNKV